MANFGTHFDFDPGRLPAELPVRWGTAAAWTISTGVRGALDNRVLRRAHAPDYASYVQWTRPGLVLAQQEILVRFRLMPAEASDISLRFLHSIAGVRMGGERWTREGSSTADGKGYLLQYNGSAVAGVGQRLQLLRVSPGTDIVAVTVLATHVMVLDPAAWYLARLRADGTTINAKVWLADAVEPGAWQMSVVSGTHTSGGVGPVVGHGVGAFDAMAVATDGDTAELPAVAPPPAVPVMDVLPGCQDVTLFEDDDETPIGGAVVSGGDVLLATYSTHQAHPRPWLVHTEDFGESRVNFREGSGTIGSCTWEVLDWRTDPTDQDSGHFTALMSRAGYGRIVNRRVVMRQQNADGSWRVLMDGVMMNAKLNDDLSSYSVPTRDIRERERTMRAFTRNNGAWSIFPKGPAVDYGRALMSVGGVTMPRILMPAVAGYAGTVQANGPATARRVKLDVPGSGKPALIRGWAMLANLRDWGAPHQTYSADGNGFESRFTDVIVEWRPIDGSGNPTGAWVRLVDMPQISGTPQDAGNVFIAGMGGVGTKLSNTTWNNVLIVLNSMDTSALPAVAQRVQVRVTSNRAPSEDAPIYGEGNIGDLVKQVLDGKTSDADAAPVRYNAAAMAAFVGRAFYGRWKITEPWENALQSLSEKVWKPTGYAPAIVDGLVHPIPYAMPDATVPLAQFTNANTSSADWDHGPDDIVTLAKFTFPRDYVAPDDPAEPLPVFERIREREQRYDRKAASASVHGLKKLEYNGEMFRSITFDPGGVSSAAEAAAETGRDLAQRRLIEAIDRFAEGAPHMTAIAFHDQIRVPLGGGLFRPARAGDWAIMGVTWLPDYRTARRGINRLVQIVAVNPLDVVSSSYALVDAGPLNQPLPQVDVSNALAQPDGRVSVDVGALPYHGTQPVDAAVQFAVADAEPAVDSLEWAYLVRAQKPGRYYSRALPVGSTVWVRWRGEREGERPSAWSAATTVTATDQAKIGAVALSVRAGGIPVVTWEALPGTLGVRIHWGIYGYTADPPAVLGSSADVNAALGTYTIPVLLAQSQRIRVTVEAFPGWSGAVVTGTAGQTSAPMDGIDPATNPIAWDPQLVNLGAQKVGAQGAGTVLGGQVAQSDGANTFAIVKGRQVSPPLRDGDTWVYPFAYAAVPTAVRKSEMALSWSPALNQTLDIYRRFLTEVSPTTLTLTAKLVQPGVTTLRTKAFPAGTLGLQGDELLSGAVGANTPANDDTYRVLGSGSVTVVSADGSGELADVSIGVYSSPDGITWTQRYSRDIFVSTEPPSDTVVYPFTINVPITVSGLGATAQWKIVLEYVIPDSGNRTTTVVVDPDRVDWNTATDTTVSATPRADDGLEFEVIGVS